MSDSHDDKGLFVHERMDKILKQLGGFESLFLVFSPKKYEESLNSFIITFLALVCLLFVLFVC